MYKFLVYSGFGLDRFSLYHTITTTAAPKIEWSLGNNKINKYTYFVLLSALIGVVDGFKFNSSSIENLKVKNNTIL